MRIKTRKLGTAKTVARIVKPDIIKFQGLDVQGHTLEESAAISIAADLLEGKGSLSAQFKKDVKALCEKFTKANPDFTVGKIGRPVGYSPLSKKEAPAKPAKPAKESKEVKPAKTAKAAKATKEAPKKSSKKSKK